MCPPPPKRLPPPMLHVYIMIGKHHEFVAICVVSYMQVTCRSHAGHMQVTCRSQHNYQRQWKVIFYLWTAYSSARVTYLCIYAVHMSLALHKSSALQHFKRGNVFEIHNGIMFDFYLGLLRILPYSGKFSQGRNFRNFRDQMPAHKNLFPRKFFLPKISYWRGSQEIFKPQIQ